MNQMASTAVMTQMFAASLHLEQSRHEGAFRGREDGKCRTWTLTVTS